MRRPLLWATVAIPVGFLYDPANAPLDGDDRGQFYIAERAASGVPPHASSINAKTALGFLMPAVAIRTGRVLGIPDVYAVRVYGFLMLAASVALVWLVASRLAGRRAADLAALAVLAMPPYVAAAVVGVQPKLPLVAFLLLTGLAVSGERWTIAGGAAAAAFLCWQPALVALPAAFIASLLDRRFSRNGVRVVVGALVVIAVYETYFLTQGLFLEQLSQTFLLPARFMSAYRPGVVESLQQIATNVKGFRFAMVTVPLAALWAVDYWYGLLHRHRLSSRVGAVRPAMVYWQLSAVAFAVFTILENQGMPDLFVLLPHLALGTGIVLGGLAHHMEVDRRPSRWLRAAILGFFVVGVLVGPLGQAKKITLADQRELARAVDHLAPKDEGVFAVHSAHLLALEQRDNWTRYGHFFRGVSEYLTDRYGPSFDALRRDGRLPAFVLVSRPRWIPGGVTAELASRYDRLAISEFERHGIAVYRLREDEGGAPELWSTSRNPGSESVSPEW